jgi:uncharacterized protein
LRLKDRYLKFTNSSRNTVLCELSFNADNIFTRFKGLLGTRSLASGHGLYLNECNGIHMFWMAYAIDAVFLDADLQVVGLVENIKPWAVSKIFKGAKSCLELPVGTIAATATATGDKILVEAARPDLQ